MIILGRRCFWVLALLALLLAAFLVYRAQAQSGGVYVSYAQFPCSQEKVAFYVYAPGSPHQIAVLSVTSLAQQIKHPQNQFSPYYEQRGRSVVLDKSGLGQNILISLNAFPGPYLITVTLQGGGSSVKGTHIKRDILCRP